MSTKTNFKRIALVAVAALGLGVLSSVPSQAAVVGLPTITAANGNATVQTSDSTTAATLAVKFNSTAAGDSVSISVTLGAKPASAVGGTDSVMVTVADTATSTGGIHPTGRQMSDTATAWSTQSTTPLSVSSKQQVLISSAAGVAAAKFRYELDTALVRSAGTYTLDYVVKVYSAGAEVTASAAFGQMLITVTDGTAAASGAVTAAGTSTALIYNGSSFGITAVDSSVSVVSTPATSPNAVIRITQKTAAGDPSRESITVTTTIGNVGTTSTAQGKSITFVGEANGVNDIGVFADGTSGTAVITIKTTTVTFANKSVTFFGSVATTITATPLASTIGSTSTNAILAVAKDSLGNNIRSADAVYAYSDATTVINTGTAPAGTSCGTYDSTYGGYLCSLAGSNNGTANITIRNASTSTLATVASNAVAIKVNTAPAASVKLEFDKATYAPGEVAYIIVRPLDAAGAAIGATTVSNLFATGGITSTVAFGNGSETAANLAAAVSPAVAHKVAAIDGYGSATAIQIYKVYMPSSGGAVTIKATGGTGLPSAGRVAVSATATVTDSGAAALAAVTALATTVASLKTLITTLTNLVLKIQKKVKA